MPLTPSEAVRARSQVGQKPPGKAFAKRRVIYWRLDFEGGRSRQESIDVLKAAWVMAGHPQLVARRTIDIVDERSPDIIGHIAEWLDKTSGKRLQDRSVVHVISISDPVWNGQDGLSVMIGAAEAINGGAARVQREANRNTPSLFAFPVEDDRPICRFRDEPKVSGKKS